MTDTTRHGNSLDEPMVGALDEEGKEEATFIVELWCAVFGFLRKLSVFSLVRLLIPSSRESDLFPEVWALGHLLASIALAAVSSVPELVWWEAFAIAYAGLRVFELVIYQINVLLFDEFRAKKEGKPHALRGYCRSVICAIHNYAEFIFWFALIYRNVKGAFTIDPRFVLDLGSFSSALSHSFHTMTSFGHSSAIPSGGLGTALVTLQACIGLFMIVFILARLVALLPIPATKNKFEDSRSRPR